MWSACVGVCQLLNWKIHGETLKFVKSEFSSVVSLLLSSLIRIVLQGHYEILSYMLIQAIKLKISWNTASRTKRYHYLKKNFVENIQGFHTGLS